MQVIYNNGAEFKNKKTAVALGNFDGVHIGHMSLIKKIKTFEGLCSCVWTFSEHTLNILKSDFHVPYITAKDEKIEIFKQENIGYLVFQDFNYIRYLSPEEFIEKVIIKYLNSQAVVCGFNFRFGKNGAGDAELLKEYLGKKNVKVDIIPPVVCEGQAVSSSFVRTLIQIGDMSRAKKFLGRPFSIKFPVVYGRQIGRNIGIPTINQLFPTGHVVPACGIYACTCEVPDNIGENKIYKAVTNIGVRPTIKDGDYLNAETHLIDFDGDLYGRNIKVNFYLKLRDEIKFDGLEELRAQIQKDISYARGYNFL